MVRKCPKCDAEHDRKQSYCKPCHAKYMREHRTKHSELTVDQKLRANSRSYANVYQRRGKIVPQKCEVCGSDAEKHHDDYCKPLEIRWLCRPCHLVEHRQT